jgi:ATP/maltotriose-dependent transcriptional regulator MalT
VGSNISRNQPVFDQTQTSAVFDGAVIASRAVAVRALHRSIHHPTNSCSAAAANSLRRMVTVMTESRPALTARQREVVALIAAGCSNDEVGERLGISPRTAKAHCDVLRQKLGVARRRQIPVAFRSLTGEDPLAHSSDLPPVVPEH